MELLLVHAMLISMLSCMSVKQQVQKPERNTGTGTSGQANTVAPGFLDSVLQAHPQYFTDILKNRNDLNVQVIYSQVNRNADGTAKINHHYFNVNRNQYFYPASTVKLPVVLLALEKLQALKDKDIDRNTSMLTETAYSGQTAVFNDPTSSDGRPSIAHYIKKILLVSDNDAYNRLYEFLGQQYINAELHKKGYRDVQILHRLNIFLSERENRNTNPVIFCDSLGNVVYRQEAQINESVYSSRKDRLGNGYYTGGKLKNEPMDFSKKNKLPLEDLHRMLISLVIPEQVNPIERFNISADDRRFVLELMGMNPTESKISPYSGQSQLYWPAYCKFLLFGAEKGPLPGHIRSFNKVGDAYGHLLDAAYIVDYKNKIEFFLSAVIYCNSDGILNDDKYDYERVGKPFMKNLGKVIYDYEMKRTYTHRPDLSPLLFASYK